MGKSLAYLIKYQKSTFFNNKYLNKVKLKRENFLKFSG